MTSIPEIISLDFGELFAAASPPETLRHLSVVAVRTTLDPVSSETLRARWLSPLEREVPMPWRSSSRRRHWLAGRIAARIAARQAGWALEPADMTVTAHAGGAPFLNSSLGTLDCSITHSGDWALACICPDGWLLGLDFEVGADDRVHLARRVCSPAQRELHQLDIIHNTQARRGTFGAIWTLKEALLKAWRVGLVSDLDAILVGKIPEGRVGHVSIQLEGTISGEIPFPLPATCWSAIAQWQGAPLACVATPMHGAPA